MEIPAMQLSLALNLARALGALEALGKSAAARAMEEDLDALLEQAWADEVEK